MPAVIGDLEDLTGLVRRTAHQEALEINTAAARAVQRVQEEAKRAAAQVRAEILADASRDLTEERRRQLARVALAAQHEHMTVREELLEQVWAEAERQLRQLVSQPEYPAVLRRLALAAAQVLGPGTILLAADPVGQALLSPLELAGWSEQAQAQFVGAPEPAAIWGGLLAWDADRRRQVDGSFATRLAHARAELRAQVAEMLGML
jgi:vacuolar-type H+-ATPase subunit E/Vma4